ncbi:MAG: 50S ribosomal protein L32 [Patescibacteria group bacterium]
MGLPGHRRTSSHKRRRASHFALVKVHLTKCSHCHKPIRPHLACANCGYYRGRLVLKIKSKTKPGAKKEVKEKETKE